MRTKEFIKRVEALGFGIKKESHYIRVLSNDFAIAVVYTNRIYCLNTYNPICVEWRNEDELFDLMVEYVSTPVDEREEEKKFLLRHKWIVEDGFNQYLSKCINDGPLYHKLDYFYVDGVDRIGFTKKEIEEIKDKYDTDLADFEMLEGARWQDEY